MAQEATNAATYRGFAHGESKWNVRYDLLVYFNRTIADFALRFRWAACQLDALGDCLTEAKLRKALHTLPPTLDETYARILSNIKEDYQDYAFLMLQWLCFSPRPLRLEELAEVVAVTSEEPWIHPEERLADPQDVLAICSTLITTESSPGGKEDIDPSIFYCQCRDRIDHSCMPLSCDCLWPYSSAYDLRMDYHKIHTDALQTYAHLAHFSVKEYLTSSRISANAGFSFKIYETDAHARMYSSCLAYLLHINRKDRTQPDLWLEYPLIFHATYHWHTHAQHVEQGQNHIPPLALKFLSNEENSFATWLAMSQELGPPLYHASRHGLWRSVQILLNRRVDVNAAGGRRDTAIKVAALYGHDRVVEMLIRNGANVNVEQGGPPLRAAVISGNRRVVWQLLENGADVKGPGDSDSGDCLELAVQRGDEHIVQMLLGHGTNINSWQSALKTAVMYDRIPAIRALLNHQFTSAQLRDQAIRAALTRAIRYTRASSVSLLLEHMHSQGVVIDDFGRTTLSYAAEVGETDILSMLMKHDHQYLQVADKYGRTLISYAAQSGDVAASQMLLKHSDQDIDLADARGRTPLSYAAGTGPEGLETVALLLANGRVHANSRDREGRTPLSYAVGSIISRNNVFLGGYQRHVRRMESQPDILKHQSLVKMFLEHDGTAFMIQDKYGWTPLSWAVQADHIHLVELLSPYGHRGLDQKGSDGKTPIANVLGRGSVKMLRLLSEHGVVDIKELSNDNRAWHRITQAASRGHTELVDLLLKSSSLDPRSQDITGRTLVSLAAELGNEETLKLLLSIDSSIVDLPDKTSRTPFSYVFSGDMNGSARRKAKLLLDTNAVSPDLPDENGRAPISYLAETADASLVQVLLDRNIDIERPDKRGRTPLSYALRKANDDKAVRLIFEKCTTGKNHADHAGRTPLSYAAERKWRGAIKFMLKSGFVEVNTPDKYGLTPLAYAEMAEEGRKSDGVRTSEVLRSYGAYRLDLEEPAPEGTDSHTEASGIADPERSALTTPSIEALSLAE